ncbi:MCP methyltransferase, CheR-type [Alkalilimnicola ehrlichii MLHE-1]|uniref:protein-glutamate O-methyltransferase n=1 Tax=Alkalilimnicola ehrlichii (strain ATCC BAA-1101 / DSM 17681 / MLHE-1) TaxID=187272 RepID=Q0AA91_ALKEH|nr:protein-glutamate O-methyltransferase CheR [Alkalilimnicola ehrlichii]ABI56246.1 MCP methyltransferase, CheR-type [Alkalilimnicola ehrlichii MLHE-1]
MSVSAIKEKDYQAFRQLLESSSGIVLGDNKQYLVASRLGPLMADQRVSDLGELVERLRRPGGATLRAKVVEAMTTNETQWFRDGFPFRVLRERILPDFVERGQRSIRIWSAACSSGQEAYSISMTVDEFNQSGRGAIDAEILGTDIAPRMIEMARQGRYRASVARRGLTPERQQRFFREVGDDTWEVRPEVKRRTRFQLHNLLDSYASLGRFDIIFCRNVLIYFSTDSRRDIIHRMARAVRPGGWLIVGASESLSGYAADFEMKRLDGGVVYRRA